MGARHVLRFLADAHAAPLPGQELQHVPGIRGRFNIRIFCRDGRKLPDACPPLP